MWHLIQLLIAIALLIGVYHETGFFTAFCLGLCYTRSAIEDVIQALTPMSELRRLLRSRYTRKGKYK